MSTLSKVFVILVFVIALVKLGVDMTLFAQKVDWKDKFVKEVNYHYQTQQIKNAEIAARDLEVANRNVQIGILNDRIQILDTENAAKALAITQLSKENTDKQSLLIKLESDLSVMTRQLEVQLAQIQELTTKVEEHRVKLAKALNEKSTAVAELQYARQQSERLAQDLAALEEKHTEMAREKKLHEEKLNALALSGVNVSGTAPRKTIDGKVTAVANEIGLVVISVGKDAGVVEGDEFTIYRGGEFVAKIMIERADRAWSAGKVVLKKADPRVADDASNHIFVPAPRAGGGR